MGETRFCFKEKLILKLSYAHNAGQDERPLKTSLVGTLFKKFLQWCNLFGFYISQWPIAFLRLLQKVYCPAAIAFLHTTDDATYRQPAYTTGLLGYHKIYMEQIIYQIFNLKYFIFIIHSFKIAINESLNKKILIF